MEGGGQGIPGGAGNEYFVFCHRDVNGDFLADFDGRGAAACDQLVFAGFGRGAYLSHVDNVSQFHSDGNTIEPLALNVTSLHANVLVFG